MNFHAEILSPVLSGEARDVGKWLAKKAIEIKGSRVQGFAVSDQRR